MFLLYTSKIQKIYKERFTQLGLPETDSEEDTERVDGRESNVSVCDVRRRACKRARAWHFYEMVT